MDPRVANAAVSAIKTDAKIYKGDNQFCCMTTNA